MQTKIATRNTLQIAATRREIARSVQLEMALQQRAIGRRIAQLRAQSRLTQPAAAERVGVSLRAYQDWEAGKRQPRWRNLEQLAAVFNVREEDIIGEPAPSLDGDGPDVIQRLKRIEAAIAEIKQILDDDLTGGVLPLLGDLATRDGESESTTQPADPTQHRQRQSP